MLKNIDLFVNSFKLNEAKINKIKEIKISRKSFKLLELKENWNKINLMVFCWSRKKLSGVNFFSITLL